MGAGGRGGGTRCADLDSHSPAEAVGETVAVLTRRARFDSGGGCRGGLSRQGGLISRQCRCDPCLRDSPSRTRIPIGSGSGLRSRPVWVRIPPRALTVRIRSPTAGGTGMRVQAVRVRIPPCAPSRSSDSHRGCWINQRRPKAKCPVRFRGWEPAEVRNDRVRVAQPAEAPGSNPGRCGFESRSVHRGTACARGSPGRRSSPLRRAFQPSEPFEH